MCMKIILKLFLSPYAMRNNSYWLIISKNKIIESFIELYVYIMALNYKYLPYNRYLMI